MSDGGESAGIVRRACGSGSGIYPEGSGIRTSVRVFQQEPEAPENTFMKGRRGSHLDEKRGGMELTSYEESEYVAYRSGLYGSTSNEPNAWIKAIRTGES